MKIAVNTRLLLEGRLDGMGWFSYETLRRITTGHPEHEFLFLFDRPFSGRFIFSPNILPLVVPPPARHPLLWQLWLEYSLPRVLKNHSPDLFFSPDGFLPLHTMIPSVAVIHDINFVHRPSDLPFFASRFYRQRFPAFARKAVRLATVSEYSRRDLVASFGIDPSLIDVVYNGSGDIFTPVDDVTVYETRRDYAGGNEYFVFVGNLHPRKNISGLLLAFDRFSGMSDREVHLVIAGSPLFRTGEIRKAERSMKFRARVHFTGYLSRPDLHRVVASALALCFVSFFEGFGIPVLEAMYCDIPVLASNTTSLPEICGDAALLVDPEEVDSIAGGMMRLAAEPELRNALVEKGRKQRTGFSWDLTAEKLWKTIEKGLNS